MTTRTIRFDHLTKVAERKTFYPPWKVTVYSLITARPEFTYFTCGKCSLKEKDCPSNRPEQRSQDVPKGATCAYCDKPATPFAG